MKAVPGEARHEPVHGRLASMADLGPILHGLFSVLSRGDYGYGAKRRCASAGHTRHTDIQIYRHAGMQTFGPRYPDCYLAPYRSV